jgi:drug/metabolite transporter (DMT)-like permease
MGDERSGADAPSAASARSLPLLGYALLVFLTIFWGVNWPAMKLAVSAIPVWDFRVLCLAVGGFGLVAIAAAAGQPWRPRPGPLTGPNRGEWGAIALVAAFHIVGWHMFSAWGVSLMASGRASIVAFTMPLWAALLAVPLLGEALTARKLIGLALGLAGLAALIGPELAVVGAEPWGALVMLGAATSWATGVVLMKRFQWSLSTAALAGWQLILGLGPVGLGALAFGGPAGWAEAPTTAQLVAIVYAATVPMVFCHWAWFTVVRLFPAGIAAIGLLAVPVMGVFSGALILGEAVGWPELLALALVCGALFVVLILPQRARGASGPTLDRE